MGSFSSSVIPIRTDKCVAVADERYCNEWNSASVALFANLVVFDSSHKMPFHIELIADIWDMNRLSDSQGAVVDCHRITFDHSCYKTVPLRNSVNHIYDIGRIASYIYKSRT